VTERARRVVFALRRRPLLVDIAIALVFAASALVSLSTVFELVEQDPTFDKPGKAALVVALLAITLPLALRRRFPLGAAAAVVIAFAVGRLSLAPSRVVLPAWEPYVSVLACQVALCTAVVHMRASRGRIAALAGLVGVLLAEVAREVFGGALEGLPLNQGFQLVYASVSIAFPLLLGLAVRALRARERELAAQATELQREREENARRAVLEERVRIARELHDVVAHHVSVMGIQAGAARRVLTTQPDKVEEVLSSIEVSSRQAVVELHRLLGFLRRAGQADELAPQPDLARLPDLVAQAGQGSLAVELEVAGDARPLPRTLEVSAYRVIQEALTNALKHSAGTRAVIRLDYRPTSLVIEVLDDGIGESRSANGVGGHGLIGMRERVGLHGGHLRVGARRQGGFAVNATFPVERLPA